MRAVARMGIVVGAASVVLAGAGTASANEFVVNDKGTALVVDASYSRDGAYGFVSAWQQQNGDGYLYFYEQSGDWVQCSGASTKKTTDDVYGFVGSSTYGDGTASITVAPRYARGSVTGTVTAFREDIDECAGTYVCIDLGTLPVAMDLGATGPVTTTRDRGGYHQPSGFNDRYSFTFTGRDASGTVDVAGVTSEGVGVVGKTSWAYHSN